MYRLIQGNTAKNIIIAEAGEAMTRGAAVTIKGSDGKVYKATEGTGAYLVDVAPNYDGINAVVEASDKEFEAITEGQKVLVVPAYVGESFATTEVTKGSLAVGDAIKADAGKFVAAGKNTAYDFVYNGVYSDPTGLAMYKITRVKEATTPAA